MKAIIRFVLVLALGAILGYVFHEPIDTKLKARFGDEKVEAGKARVEKGGEKAIVIGEAMFDAGKEANKSSKTD